MTQIGWQAQRQGGPAGDRASQRSGAPGGVEPAKVARPLAPYLALMLALTLVIAFLPGVVLFLPNLLGY